MPPPDGAPPAPDAAPHAPDATPPVPDVAAPAAEPDATPPVPDEEAPENPPDEEPPGLREQLRATLDAAIAMVRAHVELARAEFSEIADEVKRVALLAGVAVALLIFIALLLPIGLVLFLGEWWFGSLGWGILLVTELGIAIAVTAAALALGVPSGTVGRAIAAAAGIGLVLAVVLGLALTNAAWTRLGESSNLGVEPGVRPLVVGILACAALAALAGLIWGARVGGGSGAIAGLVGGAFLGGLAGSLSAIRFGAGPGVALGIAFGLGTWAALAGLALARQGVEGDALKARFWPSQTIETTKETIEWVRERTPLGPRR
jgi:uncharacterized membrane protein YqjE